METPSSENDTEEPDKEPVDPAIPAKALADLRALAKGNGIKPEAVTLSGFEGEVLNFEAGLVFRIEKTVAEKRAAGRLPGDSAGSAIDAQQKIDAAIERISKDREVKKHTVSILKKRPDIGFAVPGLVVRLDRHNQRFVVHDKCTQCSGAGHLPCARCHGRKELPCPKCHGRQSIMCHICRGAKTVLVQGKRVPCRHCGGDGLINCPVCRRKGRIMCPQCRGIGKSQCTQCGATGWKSHIFLASVKARAVFDFDRLALPEEVPPLIEKYGPALLLEGHAQGRIIEEIQRNAELDAQSKPHEYIVPYHIKLPWGTIRFSLGGKEVEAKLFGENALLLDMPAFLEKPASRGLSFLSRAAEGKGDIPALIHQALRRRFIGDAFLTLFSDMPQKALQALKEQYPYGFSEETLQKTISLAMRASRTATARARFMGLAAGLAAAGLLYAALFFVPEAAKVVAVLPPFAVDAAAILVGGALAALGAYQGEKSALRKILAPLLKSRKREGVKTRMTQKRLESALWGVPCAGALYCLLAVLAALQGAGPAWAQGIFQ